MECSRLWIKFDYNWNLKVGTLILKTTNLTNKLGRNIDNNWFNEGLSMAHLFRDYRFTVLPFFGVLQVLKECQTTRARIWFWNMLKWWRFGLPPRQVISKVIFLKRCFETFTIFLSKLLNITFRWKKCMKCWLDQNEWECKKCFSRRRKKI